MRMKRSAVIILALMFALVHCGAAVAAQVMRLPEDLTIIGEEAFCGSASIERVEVPAGTGEIHSRAFADSTLSEIVLPESLTSIAEDAFEGCASVFAYVEPSTYAHTWCVLNGVEYGFLDGSPTPAPSPEGVVYRALLIGNTYPGASNELNAPDDDVAGMAKMLARQSATPYAVTTQFNLSAVQMLSAISTAFADADSDDVSLFYYSGHGNDSTDEEYLGSLCGVGNTYVTVSQLRQQLDTIPGKKIILLDCCHSGAYIGRSSGTNRAEAFNSAIISAFSVKSRSNLATDSYTVLTACSQTESSWELTISGDFGVGFFSHGIASGSGYDLINRANCDMYADGNGNQDGATSLGEAYDYAVKVIAGFSAEHGVIQNVQYYGDTEFTLWGSGSAGSADSTPEATPTPTPVPTATPSPEPTEEAAGEVVYRALLVGNTYPDTTEELFAPDDNLSNMQKMFSLQKATPYTVTAQMNLTATEILEAIGTAFADADANDVSLFYYVGHGADSNSTTYLGALCGTESTYVTVDALRAKLDTIPGEKIVLLDSCHSGAHIEKSSGSGDVEAFNDAIIAAFSANSRDSLATAGYTVLTSCSQTESGYELYDVLTGYGYTLFGCGIIGGSGYSPENQAQCAMHADDNGNADGATSLSEAYSYAVEVVDGYLEAYGVEQNIQYYGSADYVLWAEEL